MTDKNYVWKDFSTFPTICMKFRVESLSPWQMLKEHSQPCTISLSRERKRRLFPKHPSTRAPLVANVSFHPFRTRLNSTWSRQGGISRRVAGWQLSGYPLGGQSARRTRRTAFFHFHGNCLVSWERNGRSRGAIAPHRDWVKNRVVTLRRSICKRNARGVAINGAIDVNRFLSLARPERVIWRNDIGNKMYHTPGFEGSTVLLYLFSFAALPRL